MQFYSTNPRNSAINIRGLGAPFGLTNDGIEPGVGLYIDGVFYARPASATLDFLDVERIEVLRGPQGTLFGKNTTAGAINVTTRKPSFTRGGDVELNFGNLGFVQAKASVTGPLGEQGRRPRCRSRARSATASLYNVSDAGRRQRSEQPRRARPAADRAVRQAGGRCWPPTTRRQRPEGYTQVVAGVAPTLRPAEPAVSRRSPRTSATRRRASTPSIASPTSTRRCARTRTSAAPSLNVDWKVGARRADVDHRLALLELESVERPRLHRPAGHDRSRRRRRSSASGRRRSATPATCRRGVNFVVGGFAFHQTIESDPVVQAGAGRRRPRASCSRRPPAAATPGLLDGYGFDQFVDYGNTSAARLRPGRAGGHRSAAPAARPAVQLRPEERRLRPAGLRRPADDRPGADRAAAVGPRAAGLRGRRRRHQPVGTDHAPPTGSRRASTPTRPTRPASSRSAST